MPLAVLHPFRRPARPSPHCCCSAASLTRPRRRRPAVSLYMSEKRPSPLIFTRRDHAMTASTIEQQPPRRTFSPSPTPECPAMPRAPAFQRRRDRHMIEILFAKHRADNKRRPNSSKAYAVAGSGSRQCRRRVQEVVQRKKGASSARCRTVQRAQAIERRRRRRCAYSLKVSPRSGTSVRHQRRATANRHRERSRR